MKITREEALEKITSGTLIANEFVGGSDENMTYDAVFLLEGCAENSVRLGCGRCN
jgi:hypothetical protein